MSNIENAIVNREVIDSTMKALEKNNMNAYFVETKGDVCALVKTLLNSGDVVASGGSVTLNECGVLDMLRGGDYKYLDRTLPGLSPEETGKIMREAFFADAYLTSTNALTQDGALVNIDGNANRVAAITFGPKKVIIVVGVNKITADEKSAFERVSNIAAPKNTKRLNLKTPCSVTGKCENCKSPDRICCAYTVHRQQRHIGRINVIIVNENLGF